MRQPTSPGSRQISSDEILAATAHELRLPLSHIKGFVTSLRRTDVTWDAERQREFLADIEVETDRLVDLVDSLCAPRSAEECGHPATALHISLTPAADLAPTSPAAVVHGALERMRGLPKERELHLDLPPDLPSIQMDPTQMERVLVNLIQNAIHHSPARAGI